jgi:hypothetical protein
MSAVQNTLLATLNFPDLLFAQPFIAARLANFRHFRSGVRVTFRVSGNRFLYGVLVASWDPATALDANSSHETNIYAACGFPHVLIDANSVESDAIDIPYGHSDVMLDIPSYRSGHIGSVELAVAAPLRSVNTSSVSSSITVQVYAQFIDPVVSMPTPTISVASPDPVVYTVLP